MFNLNKILRNLLFIVNLAIIAGFAYGLAKSIINISSNQYVHHKMYNLIFFDLESFTIKYVLLFIVASIAIFILATVCKLIVSRIKLSSFVTEKRFAILIASILIIAIPTTIAYLYSPQIISFLKSNSSTKWLGNFSASQNQTYGIFIQASIIFAVALLTLILYVVWPAIFNYPKRLIYSILNPRKVIYSGLALFGFLILLNLSASVYKGINTPTSPNVIIITIDTLRADRLGCYGNKRNTSPNIDRFAQKGVLYENAISQAPWTLPSMMSMYTSLYPSHVGAKDIHSNFMNELLTLPEFMKNNFYNTIAVVSHIVVSKVYGFSQGFDTFNQKHIAQVDEISSEIITQQAVEYISKNKAEKFFLWVHYFDPHQNYRNHAEYNYSDGYAGPLPANLDNEKLNEMTSSLNEKDIEYVKSVYDEEIAYTDKHIGRLLDSIDKFGLGNDTIIILTSDHGEEFMERGRFGHGTSLYRELTHVPLIIYNPLNNSMRGKRVSKHVEIRNIAKTILELSSINEDIFQGVNLLDYEKLNLDHIVISENYGFQKGNRTEAIIYQNWKLINNANSQVSELYQIDRDKNETNNIYTMNNEEINIQKEKLQSIISMINNNNEEDSDESELSKEDIKQLKALGYIQ